MPMETERAMRAILARRMDNALIRQNNAQRARRTAKDSRLTADRDGRAGAEDAAKLSSSFFFSFLIWGSGAN